MVGLVALLVFAFKAWMLIDAVRRRADSYWFWIILGIPGGGIAYFVMVRARDYDAQILGRKVMSTLRNPPQLKVLEARYEETPSLLNQIAYAQGLADAERFEEARDLFDAVLKQRPAPPRSPLRPGKGHPSSFPLHPTRTGLFALIERPSWSVTRRVALRMLAECSRLNPPGSWIGWRRI